MKNNFCKFLIVPLLFSLLTTQGFAANKKGGNTNQMTAEEINSKYNQILLDKQKTINKYDWQDGASKYDNKKKTMRPVALYDITGDKIPELFFMSADTDYASSLFIYTYKDNKVAKMTFDKAAQQYGSSGNAILQDILVSAGTTYAVYTNKEKNRLIIYDSNGGVDASWYNFTIYKIEKGALKFERKVVKTIDWEASKTTYKINEKAVNATTGKKEFEKLFKDIDKMIMYSTNRDDFSKLGFKFTKAQDMRKTLAEAKKSLTTKKSVSPKKSVTASNKNSDKLNKSADTKDVAKLLQNKKFFNQAGPRDIVNMEIKKDLSFSGVNNAHHMDSKIVLSYEYQSNFKGKFEIAEKIDDYTYNLKLVDFKIVNPKEIPKEYRNKKDTKFEYVDEVSGIKKGDKFKLYLPGRTKSDLEPALYGPMGLGSDNGTSSSKTIEKTTIHNKTQNSYFIGE
ncbi:hypothetical protein HMPREF0379_1769 [[Eubacterium] yurii subsp. margaretiae ATCC 43715]|nr:hypothetical protein HMPREF0379_1769 [[Eubacterium] yurii subsp. margaretiae ATCC 43715]